VGGKLSIPNLQLKQAMRNNAIDIWKRLTRKEPERRMVLVVRWIDGDYADAFFGRVLEALDDQRLG
jgi:hypothetical protein